MFFRFSRWAPLPDGWMQQVNAEIVSTVEHIRPGIYYMMLIALHVSIFDTLLYRTCLKFVDSLAMCFLNALYPYPGPSGLVSRHHRLMVTTLSQ